MCAMLGKKISTLSTLIDGEQTVNRSAFLSGANEAQAKMNRNAQSGQEELTDFFASVGEKDSSTNSGKKGGKKKQEPRVVGRGSIESFFARAHATNKRSQPSSSRPKTQSLETAPNVSPASEFVKWSCSVCTLDNKHPRKLAEVYECSACGASYSRWNQKESIRCSHTFVTPTTSSKKRKIVSGPSPTRSSLVIDLCIEEDDQITKSNDRKDQVIEIIDCPPADSHNSVSPWFFSVSKNSGRVTIHHKEDSNSKAIICCNFQIDQILSSDTLDAPLNNESRHVTQTHTRSALSFDAEALQEMAEKVFQSMPRMYLSETSTRCLKRQTKLFCEQYLGLRPIEQKALQLSGQLFKAQNLARVATQLVLETSSTCGDCTTRYAGGFRRQVYQKQQSGTELSTPERAVLEGRGCAWCGKSLTTSQCVAETIFCSQDCAEQGRLRGGGMYASTNLRATMFALEGGICRLCKVDAHRLFKQVCAVPPSDRLNRLLDAGWKLPASRKALEKLLQNPKEGDFWQVDHIQAVSLGGGDCGLDNLRTLCVPCHRLETEKLRGNLKRKSGPAVSESKHKQVDIRSAFGSLLDKRSAPKG